MVKCDMCHKGVIRWTQKEKPIYCKYCAGTGRLWKKGEYRLKETIRK